MKTLLYVFTFLAIVTTTLFLYYQKQQQDRNHIDSVTLEIKTNYKAFLRQYEKVSAIIYDEIIHDKKALELLNRLHRGEGEELEALREEFIEHISYIKRQVDHMNFSQIHFHDANINSLYRSHAPYKYGDSLEEFRKSVAYVNKHKEYTYGLEEGRVINGFRFVYPIFYEEEFIGSVGFSIGTRVMQNELADIYSGNFWIVLDRALIESVTFEDSYNEFYVDTPLSKSLIVEKNINNIKKLEHLLVELKESGLDKELDFKETYELVKLDGKNYLVLLTPLENIDGKRMGYLVYATQDRYLSLFRTEFVVAASIFTVLWIIVLISSLKIFRTHSKLMLENSKRKEAEHKLKNLNTHLEDKVKIEIEKRAQKESLLSSIFENAPLGIVVSDENRVVRDVNPAFLYMTGYEKQDIVAKSIQNISIKEEEDMLLKFQKELLAGKRDTYTLEKGYIKQDGSIIRANVYVSRLKGKGNLLLGMIEDITQKKELDKKQRVQEEMLIQQSKMAMMGEMMGAIAHQWRQPLNSLSMLIQNLEDAYEFGSFDEDMLRDSVAKSMFQIEYMSRTIDDFRNFYRPDKHKKKFDILSSINHVIQLIHAQLAHHNIEIVVDSLEGFEFYAHGVESEFRQVILNILSNAKDSIIASKDEGSLGRIRVNLLKDGEKNVVEICDSGSGVPEEIASRIFEPYFTTKLDSKGTGVGLYMSKIIIENNMDG
ncbi:MAG: PAS domain S-box protein, partial [Campylobacterales bacterium]